MRTTDEEDLPVRWMRKSSFGVHGPLYVRLDDLLDALERYESDAVIEWLKKVRRERG